MQYKNVTFLNMIMNLLMNKQMLKRKNRKMIKIELTHY